MARKIRHIVFLVRFGILPDDVDKLDATFTEEVMYMLELLGKEKV